MCRSVTKNHDFETNENTVECHSTHSTVFSTISWFWVTDLLWFFPFQSKDTSIEYQQYCIEVLLLKDAKHKGCEDAKRS